MTEDDVDTAPIAKGRASVRMYQRPGRHRETSGASWREREGLSLREV